MDVVIFLISALQFKILAENHWKHERFVIRFAVTNEHSCKIEFIKTHSTEILTESFIGATILRFTRGSELNRPTLPTYRVRPWPTRGARGKLAFRC